MSKNHTPQERRGAVFGRRKGHKLRPRRAELLARLLPKLSLDVVAPAPLDPRNLFSIPVAGVTLEIGFGAGEHFVREALANPDLGCIGVEPFVNGMASVLALIDASKLQNVRLHHGDAIDVLEWLPAQVDRTN